MFSKDLSCRHGKTRTCLGKVKETRLTGRAGTVICTGFFVFLSGGFGASASCEGLGLTSSSSSSLSSIILCCVLGSGSSENVSKVSQPFYTFNPIPDDKILGFPKLKAFADDKLNVTKNVEVVFHRIENIVEKEENAGYQHFLLFPQCFQKDFSSKCIESCHCVVKSLPSTA